MPVATNQAYRFCNFEVFAYRMAFTSPLQRFNSKVNKNSEEFQRNYRDMSGLVDELHKRLKKSLGQVRIEYLLFVLLFERFRMMGNSKFSSLRVAKDI
jgi:hypothetical protein